jgi:myo-inositol 2-dehydrogenase/D-chiro-inositol 1-dehydrogenase
VSNTRYNPRGYDVRLELHGTADSVAAGWLDSTPLRNLERDTGWPSGEPWTFFMDRLADAFRAELTAFTEVVAGQRPSPCTVHDALAVTWIAEAATLSLEQHRPVQTAEVRQRFAEAPASRGAGGVPTAGGPR